jgi:CDP-diacylglycerol--serine O-phosphatidyltransferase
LAIRYAFGEQLVFASFFILLGAFLDFFDGFFARLLKVSGELGEQLDSLADLITFGVAPSIIAFQLLIFFDSGKYFFLTLYEDHSIPTIAYLAFLIPIFSAYRLAKFNIDTNQKDAFSGLPTPANALFFISIPLAQHYQTDHKLLAFMYQSPFLIISILVLCTLMVSNLRLIALKFKSWNWTDNTFRFLLIAISIVLLLFLHFVAVPIIILLYIVLSLINNLGK